MKTRLIPLALAALMSTTSFATGETGGTRPRTQVAHAVPSLPTGSIADDIASAGQLRTQSQRLAKLWLQSGLGINAGSANAQLARGIVLFDNALAALLKNRNDPQLQRSLQRTSALWADYRAALAAPYGNEALSRVNYLAEDLMLATGKLTMQVEAGASTATGRLLDLSLRQNMLAQRLARLYLMAQAGDRSRSRLVDMEQTRKEFATALGELIVARENTPASRDALELARMQWMFFDNAISEMNRGSESRPQHVATTSERIMEVLDAVSRQYAQDYGSAKLAGLPAVARN